MTESEKKQIQKILLIITGGITAALLALCLLCSIYTVKETEVAVITTFGEPTIVSEKGLHFRIPFIQKLTKVDTTIQGFPVGYSDGTNTDTTAEELEKESIMMTSDFNFVNIDFYVSYQIKDPIKYLYASDQPEAILKNIAMSSIRSVISSYTVDAALTTGKSEIQYNCKELINELLAEQDLGINLVDISIQDVEPPTDEIKDAFKAVETAKQNKESVINNANKYRNESIPAAEAEVDKILQDAEASKNARINEAIGQVSMFNEQYAEYQKYPLITKQRIFYETMEELLPTLKVIIDDGSGNIEKYYPIESFATISGTTAESAAGTTTTTN